MTLQSETIDKIAQIYLCQKQGSGLINNRYYSPNTMNCFRGVRWGWEEAVDDNDNAGFATIRNREFSDFFLRNMLSKIMPFLLLRRICPMKKPLKISTICLFLTKRKPLLLIIIIIIIITNFIKLLLLFLVDKQATSSYLALWEIFINRCKDCYVLIADWRQIYYFI